MSVDILMLFTLSSEKVRIRCRLVSLGWNIFEKIEYGDLVSIWEKVVRYVVILEDMYYDDLVSIGDIDLG